MRQQNSVGVETVDSTGAFPAGKRKKIGVCRFDNKGSQFSELVSLFGG